MNPILQHFLETLITWGVPTGILATTIVGIGAIRTARSNRKNKNSKKNKDKKNDGKTKKKRKSNPATELYDDLYVNDDDEGAGSRGKSPQEEVLEFLRQLRDRSSGAGGGRQKKEALIRKNRGIPPIQYITLTNWNEKLDSYQYGILAGTKSKAVAAAQYRQRNFDRVFTSSVLSTSNNNNNGDGNNNNNMIIEPNTRAKLLELEETFLREGAKLVQTIQTKQTKLTRHSIEKEMERMGIIPFEMDPPEEEDEEEQNNNNDDEITLRSVGPQEDNKSNDTKENKDLKVKRDGNDKTATTTTKDDDNNKDDGDDDDENQQEQEQDEEVHWNKLQEAQRKLMELELQFIKDLVATLGRKRATAIEVALVGDIKARGSGGLLTQLQERPLSTMLPILLEQQQQQQQEDSTTTTTTSSSSNDIAHEGGNTSLPPPPRRPKSCLFVTRFPGDTRASRVQKLREEITAIVRNAEPGVDEALVILESGGGTVTGYGLAAGQLQRMKQAGLKLTIVVEQVAASGGYMMCCVGDKIIGSPFAAFGSIGVITEIPNVHSRLKREGVEFQTVTAGDYKRTLTPFKEVTQEDFNKTKDDLEAILTMFQKFVQKNRPNLNIEEVATGEVWFGTDAVDRGLCDQISTADDVLMDYVDKGWDVYEVEYKKPSRLDRFRGWGGISSDGEAVAGNEIQDEKDNILSRGIRWLVRSVVSEVKSIVAAESEEMAKSKQQELKYMARFDGADQIRSQSSKY